MCHKHLIQAIETHLSEWGVSQACIICLWHTHSLCVSIACINGCDTLSEWLCLSIACIIWLLHTSLTLCFNSLYQAIWNTEWLHSLCVSIACIRWLLHTSLIWYKLLKTHEWVTSLTLCVSQPSLCDTSYWIHMVVTDLTQWVRCVTTICVSIYNGCDTHSLIVLNTDGCDTPHSLTLCFNSLYQMVWHNSSVFQYLYQMVVTHLIHSWNTDGCDTPHSLTLCFNSLYQMVVTHLTHSVF